MTVVNLMVGCHYFPPGLWLPSQPEHHRPLASTKLYSLLTEAHGCEQLAQSCYLAAERTGIELVTDALTTTPPSHKFLVPVYNLDHFPDFTVASRQYFTAYLLLCCRYNISSHHRCLRTCDNCYYRRCHYRRMQVLQSSIGY